MTPYYDDGTVALYHGRFEEVLPDLGIEDDGTRWQPTVIQARTMHRKAINETEKPTEIVEPLIQYGCQPGGLVLDLFAGSRVVLEAARRLGMRGIGVEMREGQCEKAAKRLSSGQLRIGDLA